MRLDQEKYETEYATTGGEVNEMENGPGHALRAAEFRMSEAKRLFTASALSCLKGSHRAAEEVAIALREIEYARQCVRVAMRELEPPEHPEPTEASA
jgi:hypothetical protein